MSSVGTIYRPLFMPSLDLGNATAEKQFLNSQSTAVVLPLQNDGQCSNHRLRGHLGGRVQTTSNLTFALSLYFGSTNVFGAAGAIASNTQLYTSSGLTVNAIKSNFFVDMDFFWDADSKTFCGVCGPGQIANQIIGPSNLVNIPSADPNLHINSNSFQSVFYGLTVTGLFSGSSAGNHAFLDIFTMELL